MTVWGVFRYVAWESNGLQSLHLTQATAEEAAIDNIRDEDEWGPVAPDDPFRRTGAVAEWAPDGRAGDESIYVQALEVSP